ncbi:SDR family oxidoreductase [Bordetella petrii]|uniref:SDR family oxidoreductase n=1 Tax=Bordetella petrii TaxID=94624 RepID=UPI001A97725D|nr:SDR family oxidoreductase [Bordetella petrii]MBO1112470.1 SDR family oxidoreductase [Bordetella petrii]
MDLGIAGRWAVVCGASKGLGHACALALAREGVHLVMAARTRADLDASAAHIRAQTGVQVIAVPADVTTESGRARALGAAPQIDILVTNAGGPPPGDFRGLARADWLAALEANMLTPIEMIRHAVGPMIERGFGRIVNITSSAAKAPVDILCLSNGARAGLSGFAGGAARQIARHNVTLNNLLPGKFDTGRLRSNNAARARRSGLPLQEEIALQTRAIPAGRYGDPDEFGAACAFLCSAHAGYITGQNILIDGGAYPGLF